MFVTAPVNSPLFRIVPLFVISAVVLRESVNAPVFVKVPAVTVDNVVFQCDNEGSYLSGWTLTKEYLESRPVSTTNPQTIKIYADGNIGCYGHA